jgi:hypothetical protein
MIIHSPDEPVQEWTPDNVNARWAHIQQIHQEQSEAGELLAAEKLALIQVRPTTLLTRNLITQPIRKRRDECVQSITSIAGHHWQRAVRQAGSSGFESTSLSTVMFVVGHWPRGAYTLARGRFGRVLIRRGVDRLADVVAADHPARRDARGCRWVEVSLERPVMVKVSLFME